MSYSKCRVWKLWLTGANVYQCFIINSVKHVRIRLKRFLYLQMILFLLNEILIFHHEENHFNRIFFCVSCLYLCLNRKSLGKFKVDYGTEKSLNKGQNVLVSLCFSFIFINYIYFSIFFISMIKIFQDMK